MIIILPISCSAEGWITESAKGLKGVDDFEWGLLIYNLKYTQKYHHKTLDLLTESVGDCRYERCNR